MSFDLLIRGGLIVDGSGLPAYRGDVAVKDGRIAEVGHVDKSAARTIDADGLAVAPGFIDHHTHLDAQLFWDPYGTSEPQHGVTSVVMGNCGLTLAPVKDEDRGELVSSLARVEGIPRQALEAGVPWGWHSFGEYLDALEGRIGLNAGCLTGHVALRHHVMGADSLEREATPGEVDAMRQLLSECLQGGSLGFSTNRNTRHNREDGRPVASRLAAEEEVYVLCEVLRDLNAGMILSSSGAPMAMFDQIARRSQRPLVWQSVQHHWHKPNEWREQLETIAHTFEDGYQAYGLCNALPIIQRFTMKNTQRFDEMPTWKNLMFVPEPARKEAMADPATRSKLQAEWDHPDLLAFHRRWDLVDVHKAATPENRSLEGKNIQQVADLRGKTPLDAFLDLSLDEDLATEFQTLNAGGDAEAMGEILRSPHVVVGLSDAGAHVQFHASNGYSTTLLGRWVRDAHVLTLEQAVFKLTFQVASIYGLRDRGLLRPGFAADITLFDPLTVAPGEEEWADDFPAGTRRMVAPSHGLHYTIVNGRVVYENGRISGDLPGKVLRGAAYAGVPAAA